MDLHALSGRLRTVRRWVLTGGIFALPVFFLPNVTHDPHDLPKLALLLALAGFAAGLRIAESCLSWNWAWSKKALFPAACIAVPVAWSWLFSAYRGWSLFGQYSRWQGLLPYLAVAALALLVADAFNDRVRDIAWALTAAAGVVGTYGFLQALGIDPLLLPDAVGFTGSTIGNTNFTGGFLGITLPVCAVVWGTGREGRVPAMLCTIACALGLLFTNSQGGWAAGLAGVSIVVGCFLGKGRRTVLVAGRVAVGAIVVLMIGLAAVPIFSDASPTDPGFARTARLRGVEWSDAVDASLDRPLVGLGPNGYAVEGTRFRSLENAIASGAGKADDPHSLPLAWFANLGLAGLAGSVLLGSWTLRNGRLVGESPGTGTAFYGGAVAYFVQALVSIDEIPIRVTFWVMIGAIAALAGAGSTTERPSGRTLWRVSAATLALLGALAGTLWSWGLIKADAEVNTAVAHFAARDVAEGKRSFEAALRFRDEFRYREMYAENLGIAALNEGRDGAPLIAEMLEVGAYVDRFPESHVLWKLGRILHYWGHVDPSADVTALSFTNRALVQDPENPLLLALKAEILLDLDRPEEAREVLAPAEQEMRGHILEYWTSVAFVAVELDDLRAAREALHEAADLDPNHCRVLLTEELIRLHSTAPGSLTRPDDHLSPFALALTCDAGFLDFFRDHIPSAARPFFR